jgi:competence transcription factor ComK
MDREFPYKSVDEARADSYRKCGVSASWKAFELQLVRTGFYQVMFRKDRNNRLAEDRAKYLRVLELAKRDKTLAAAVAEAESSKL